MVFPLCCFILAVCKLLLSLSMALFAYFSYRLSYVFPLHLVKNSKELPVLHFKLDRHFCGFFHTSIPVYLRELCFDVMKNIIHSHFPSKNSRIGRGWCLWLNIRVTSNIWYASKNKRDVHHFEMKSHHHNYTPVPMCINEFYPSNLFYLCNLILNLSVCAIKHG